MPTPANLRSRAGELTRLALELDVASSRLRDEPDRGLVRLRLGLQLEQAAANIRRSVGHIREVADALAEQEAARQVERTAIRWRCEAEGGVCPDHGDTLSAAGGRSWCRVAGCDRVWPGDRRRQACPEAAVYRVRDARGAEQLLCSGHAILARADGADPEAIGVGEG